MLSFKPVVLAVVFAGADASVLRRWLSLPKLAGYNPGSDVGDHSRIDLDQQKINEYVDEAIQASYDLAGAVYTKGGFSKSVAKITVSGGLGASLKKSDEVVGTSQAGEQIVLTPKSNYESSATEIELVYTDGNCNVGGLDEASRVLDGCLAVNGTITPGSAAGVSYTYDPLTGNTNDRTIQYFSTTADTRMRQQGDSNSPFYPSFQPFVDYYGDATYGDKWVTAAFSGTSTGFSSNRGDADFSEFDLTARAEAIKKGTVYLNVWMYVLRELEHGLEDCDAECTEDDCVGDSPTGSVDEAVAFYTGSLEGTQGTLGDGYLLYSLANKRCQNFKTCGHLGKETEGNSYVNVEVMKQFSQMAQNLASKDCDGAKANRDRIVQLMTVPLVQATLRYADKMANDPSADDADKVETASFAAAVLPLVHACNAADADTIYQNMNANNNQGTDFAAVKGALERNYGCLGVSCAEVGGVIDDGTGTYKDGAAPCGGAGDTSSSSVNVGLAVGLSVGAVAAILLVYLWCKCCRKSNMVETKSGGDENAVA